MKLVSFFRLESNEKLVFFQSLYWLWYFRVRLHHMPFNSLIQKAKDKSNHCLLKSKPTNLTVNRAAWFVNRATHFVPDTTCLVVAFAGKVVLSIHGHETTLVIGVKKGDSNEILSHAWLEHGGQIIIGNLGDIDQYLQITKFG